MSDVLILGGYGNFGRRIASRLAQSNISVTIAGRNKEKAQRLATTLQCEYAVFDATQHLNAQLKQLKPTVVINTCGPFQGADYAVAKTCIANQANYIDLADDRSFVCGITALNDMAKHNNVSVTSGASTVPGLSSAVLEQYKHEFSQIDSLVFGITPGQKTSRGLATTQSILSYLGKALKPTAGSDKISYGWQDIYQQEYPQLGKRWMANCDIPDLDLFPQKYHIKSIQFSAGMENTFLHLGIWALSWFKRFGLPIKLENHANILLNISHWFDRFGTADGGMHIIITGKDKHAKSIQKSWFIIAKNGDGPQIPCVPAIVLTKKLLQGKYSNAGATPCIGLVTLDEYLHELQDFAITSLIKEANAQEQCDSKVAS